MYDSGRGSGDGKQAEVDVSPAEVSRGCLKQALSRRGARQQKRAEKSRKEAGQLWYNKTVVDRRRSQSAAGSVKREGSTSCGLRLQSAR
jgi:hypothetical protein